VSAHVFVVDPAAAHAARVGDRLAITGSEGEHAVRVARVRPGERIQAVDGQGRRIHGLVRELGRDSLVAEVLDVVQEPVPDPAFVVVQALPKGEHAELAVDQLTQAGVDRIVPWAAANCVVRWDEQRSVRGRGKWQQVALAAAKQSRRAWIPQVQALTGTPEVLAMVPQAELSLVLHEGAAAALAEVDPPMTGTVLLIVGPEGGLAEQERAMLTEAGAHQVRLGEQVLRTSLAGAAALAVLQAAGRWRSSGSPARAVQG